MLHSFPYFPNILRGFTDSTKNMVYCSFTKSVIMFTCSSHIVEREERALYDHRSSKVGKWINQYSVDNHNLLNLFIHLSIYPMDRGICSLIHWGLFDKSPSSGTLIRL